MTAEEILSKQTPGGGWSKETLASWGVAWPPPAGWKDRLVQGAPKPHPMERPCPKCGAEPWVACIGKRGARKALHRERGRRQGASFKPLVGETDALTESPIETMLLQAIRGWLGYNFPDVEVVPQAKIGPYRADILIEDRRREVARKLVVECDGRAFHSSEPQVDRDRRRDRWFVANDIYVMRFSGSEIHRDRRGCAAQVGQWIGARL